ncbi:related to Vacuolar protein-sorting-associated protein 36 [Saccharomycodes ludwigii]|uniref:Vacuolar protein-sorting-associated protein 36 n=1 Tax=Saccharomycodes ludwigii TaxID=36035 RepID=A0A376B7F8_9ASCO|nr:hypothetical protein SCDLUD_004293 [Saccharomycodes ludwigii]KAH3899977.1 hypothetical protein SCDLUD_004293 [Saccharomycodes ludwigii]SSD60414.1 related to Vacuolar protein-sorting-associated protein 36 [Saccharomycodes ludwigii]
MLSSIWHYAETTKSGQPLLRETEKDIVVIEKVGLSQGKYKILNKQNGRFYLTTQRLIYVDDLDFFNESCFIDLNEIKSIDYSSRFWKSSPKLIIYFDINTILNKSIDKKKNKNYPNLIGNSFTPTKEIVWDCPICMMNNTSSINLPKIKNKEPFVCVNCGIPYPYEDIMKHHDNNNTINTKNSVESASQCPKCTFINHPSLMSCEICGSKLPNNNNNNNNMGIDNNVEYPQNTYKQVKLILEGINESDDTSQLKSLLPGESNESNFYVKISFRNRDNNGILFYEALSKTLHDLCITQSIDKFNQNCTIIDRKNGKPKVELLKINKDQNKFGITGLEESNESKLLANDILMGNALQDLDRLVELSEDIIKMYSHTTTTDINKDMKPPKLLIDRGKFTSKSSFICEISREIFDFLMNLSERNENLLLINILDLYALYNKTVRIGCGYISPFEFEMACEQFDKLNLSDKLHIMTINDRIQCLTTNQSLKNFKETLLFLINDQPGLDLYRINKYLHDIDGRKTWSMGIIAELLQMCIQEGSIVVDDAFSGEFYYSNIYWKND